MSSEHMMDKIKSYLQYTWAMWFCQIIVILLKL